MFAGPRSSYICALNAVPVPLLAALPHMRTDIVKERVAAIVRNAVCACVAFSELATRVEPPRDLPEFVVRVGSIFMFVHTRAD
jgi:hypothetical protein